MTAEEILARSAQLSRELTWVSKVLPAVSVVLAWAVDVGLGYGLGRGVHWATMAVAWFGGVIAVSLLRQDIKLWQKRLVRETAKLVKAAKYVLAYGMDV